MFLKSTKWCGAALGTSYFHASLCFVGYKIQVSGILHAYRTPSASFARAARAKKGPADPSLGTFDPSGTLKGRSRPDRAGGPKKATHSVAGDRQASGSPPYISLTQHAAPVDTPGAPIYIRDGAERGP